MASGCENQSLSHSQLMGSEETYNYFCQPCDTDGRHIEARGYCVQCAEYLCRECMLYHTKLKQMRNHVFLDMKQLKDKRPASCGTALEKCTEHAGRFIEYFCASHDELGCNACITLDHRNCVDVNMIQKISKGISKGYEYKALDSKLKHITSTSKEIIDDMKKQTTSLDKYQSDITATVQQFRKEIINILDKMEQDIALKYEDLKTQELNKMDSISATCSKTMKEVKAIADQLEYLQKNKQDGNLYIAMKKAKKKIISIEDGLKAAAEAIYFQKHSFKPNTGLLDMLNQPDALGKVDVEVNIATYFAGNKGSGSGHVPSSDLINRQSSGKVTKATYMNGIDVSLTFDRNKRLITGSAIVSNNELVIADVWNNKVKVIDMDSDRVISELTLSSNPWDVAMIDTKKFAVTLPSQEKIVYLNNDLPLAVDKEMHVSGQCHGIACSAYQLIVTFIYPAKVEIMDLSGSVLKTISTDVRGELMFSDPQHVTASPDDQSFYVSDIGFHTVTRLNRSGSKIGTYSDKDMQSPRQVATDSHGMLYICGSDSHNIHQVTANCGKVRIILNKPDGLKEPTSLSLNERTQKLYVGMDNGLKVFQLSKLQCH